MPVYEYACKSCGHRFDLKQSFHDEPVATCPECGAHVQRVLHPAGIIFKGSGWYITDSRQPSGGEKSNGKESTTAAKSESSETAAATTPAESESE
jgi:putative FmdB family regulatory protein